MVLTAFLGVRQRVAAGCVVVALAASGCEVRLGPPPQDLGDEPDVTAASYCGQVSR